MEVVAPYLSNFSMKLPFCQESSFFMHGRMRPNLVERELDFGYSTHYSLSFSINEMFTSNFFFLASCRVYRSLVFPVQVYNEL